MKAKTRLGAKISDDIGYIDLESIESEVVGQINATIIGKKFYRRGKICQEKIGSNQTQKKGEEIMPTIKQIWSPSELIPDEKENKSPKENETQTTKYKICDWFLGRKNA